jgi:hypothetical protein
VSAADWCFSVGKASAIFDKLATIEIHLEDIAERIAQGIRTSANEVYVLDLISEEDGHLIAKSKQLSKNVGLES